MSWHAYQFLAIANLAICGGIAWACLCRLNSEICKRFKLARTRYTILLAGAVASGMQPLLWGSWPTIGAVILAACVLAWLALNIVRWSRHTGHPMSRKEDR